VHDADDTADGGTECHRDEGPRTNADADSATYEAPDTDTRGHTGAWTHPVVDASASPDDRESGDGPDRTSDLLDVSWSVTGAGEFALVAVTLVNPSPVDRVVRVDNRLDGPVLPPRGRDGVVVTPGWDDQGYRGVVEAGDRRCLGYAVAAPVARPPVAVTDEGRAGPDDRPRRTTPAAARRALASHRPPRDAVPLDLDADADAGVPVSTGTPEASGSEGGSDRTTLPVRDGGAGRRDTAVADGGPSSAGLPAATSRWIDRVETRIEYAERLTGASVPEATAVLSDAGGLGAATGLPARLEADVAHLRRVARRASRLADRAEATDVPVDALRRLA
jgi:hypothetical protein